jgi:hypothetical protein
MLVPSLCPFYNPILPPYLLEENQDQSRVRLHLAGSYDKGWILMSIENHFASRPPNNVRPPD